MILTCLIKWPGQIMVDLFSLILILRHDLNPTREYELSLLIYIIPTKKKQLK
jgi:hypothetical protein